MLLVTQGALYLMTRLMQHYLHLKETKKNEILKHNVYVNILMNIFMKIVYANVNY